MWIEFKYIHNWHKSISKYRLHACIWYAQSQIPCMHSLLTWAGNSIYNSIIKANVNLQRKFANEKKNIDLRFLYLLTWTAKETPNWKLVKAKKAPNKIYFGHFKNGIMRILTFTTANYPLLLLLARNFVRQSTAHWFHRFDFDTTTHCFVLIFSSILSTRAWRDLTTL